MQKVSNVFESDIKKYAAELAKSMGTLKELIKHKEEYARLEAQLKKARYDAFLEVGFTAQQALELASK